MGEDSRRTYFKSIMMIGTLIMNHAISAVRVGILIYSCVCLMTSRTTETSSTFGEESHINPTMTFGETSYYVLKKEYMGKGMWRWTDENGLLHHPTEPAYVHESYKIRMWWWKGRKSTKSLNYLKCIVSNISLREFYR